MELLNASRPKFSRYMNSADFKSTEPATSNSTTPQSIATQDRLGKGPIQSPKLPANSVRVPGT